VGRGIALGLLSAFDPLDIGPDEKDKKSSGVHSVWLTVNFQTCLEGGNDGVIQRYARGWL
jgi:hypothetical protein